jgi:L-fucose isomerase-like protein
MDKERIARRVGRLTERMSDISYDDIQLTPSKLEQQVRAYLSTKDVITDYGWDFMRIKCCSQMSEYDVLQCLTASLLSDPYDWAGPKDIMAVSCEGDSDEAVTTFQPPHFVSGDVTEELTLVSQFLSLEMINI